MEQSSIVDHPSPNLLQDSRLFTGLFSSNGGGGDDDEESSISNLGLEFRVGNELRLGKYCMIGGYPTRIKQLHRSAPGKHGHAKLRIVAVGIFDTKRREMIISSHDKVLVPKIEHVNNLPCIVTNEGYQLVNTQQVPRLPSILPSGEQEDENDIEHLENMQDATATRYVLVTLLIACGHFRIVTVQPTEATNDTFDSDVTGNGKGVAAPAGPGAESTVLSKKEQRKQRRKQLKQQKVAAVCVE